MSAERQRHYRALIDADPKKRDAFLMQDKPRLWRKKVKMQQEASDRESMMIMTQHEARYGDMKELKRSVEMSCMLPLCHPFTAVVAGPTSCKKTAWVLRLINNVCEKIETEPSRIWYYYGEHQPVFSNYPWIHFEEGMPQLNDEVFDGREPTMIMVDDHVRCQSTGFRHFYEDFSSSQHQHATSHSQLV